MNFIQKLFGGRQRAQGPAEREITPFFASIHNYVAVAEQVPLARLPELTNGYFTACCDAIEAEGGTIDKFIGDAVVAMFGAPQPQPDHALRACVASLKVQKQIAMLRENFSREPEKWPEVARQLRVRIGLHTGVAIVGNMGTASRFNFTMMGDNVNLATRLETGAKSYGAWVLCTDSTKRACEMADQERILFRSLGRIIVKGRAEPLELFEPLAFRAEATSALRECVARFEQGHARFREHDWQGAIERFRESAVLEPHQPGRDDGVMLNPSLAFTKMAESFLANPGTKPFVV